MSNEEYKKYQELVSKAVKEKNFNGFPVDLQKALVEHLDVAIEYISKLEALRDEYKKETDYWTRRTFAYQYLYHCFDSIHKLSFWRRFKLLLWPFLEYDEVKDFGSKDSVDMEVVNNILGR